VKSVDDVGGIIDAEFCDGITAFHDERRWQMQTDAPFFAMVMRDSLCTAMHGNCAAIAANIRRTCLALQ